MTSLSRVRTELTGFPGGPGVATMYFLNTETVMASLQAFWEDLAGSMPVDVAIFIPPAGDIIDDATGTITGAWSDEPPASIPGTSASTYVAAAGGLISWETSTILDGRRLRGRTFVVPLASPNFFTDGSLTDAMTGLLLTTGNALALAEDENFCVWHRPYPGREATEGHPARAAHAGSHGLVTSVRAPGRGAILRSRRD